MAGGWSLRGLATPLGTLYRGREGMWAWLVHRISGVAIFFFLVVHVLDTALVRISPEAYNQVIGMYHTPIMAIGEAGIVAAVTLHAFNGIRVILVDAMPWGAKYQRRMFYLVIALFLLAMAIFMPIHFRHAFNHASTPQFSYFYLAMALAPVSALHGSRGVPGGGGRRQGLPGNSIYSRGARLSRRETFGWVFMRASGVLLLVLVAGHLITNLMMGSGIQQVNFAFVAGKWANPFWQIWSLLLLLLAMAHGANGVRTLIEDYSRTMLGRFWLKCLLYLVTFTMVVLGIMVIFTLNPCPPNAPQHLIPNFCTNLPN